MARYWGQQREEALTTVGGGSENLQGVSASDRKRWDGKQDQLLYDNKPMRGSVNVLNSDAIARAFEEFKDAISTAYKQYLSTQVNSYAEMVEAVTNAKNDVDSAYAAIEKYETNMRVLYEDTLSKLTDAQNILAGATTLLNKTNTESSALSAKIKQLESVHSSIISDLGVLRNALAEVSNDADGAQARIEELISKANGVDARVAGLVKTVEDALAEIETEKEDTLAKIRAVRDSIPEDYEKVCEDVKEVRQELIDARRRGTWITSETVSGEMVHATDCAPITPLGLKLFGKGKQRQYEGNQLFDMNNNALFSNVYISTSGALGVATNSKNYSLVFEIIPNTAYTVSGIISNRTRACTVQGKISEDVNGTLNSTKSVLKDGSDTLTITSGENDSYLYINLSDSEEDFLSTLSTLMLNTGDTALPWEPYVGGEQSPNVRYPQKVEFLGESGSIACGLGAENYTIADSDWTTEERGITRTKYKGESKIRVQGVVSEASYPIGICVFGLWETANDKARLLPAGTTLYTFPRNIVFEMYDWHNDTHCYFSNRVTLETDFYLDNVFVTFPMGYFENDSVVDETIEFMLTDSLQPFTFQTPNGLRGIPLGQTIPDAIKNSPIHMSGVYWDGEQYQIANTKNENGKDVQRIGRYKITGNEDWTNHGSYTQSDGSQGWHCRVNMGQLGLPDMTHGMFTHFICGALNTSGGSCAFVGVNTIQVIDVNKLTSLEVLKDFFQNNDCYVDYILAEPITTDTTNEEKSQLDALVMNYPNTTIVNDAGAYMVLTYGKDAEAYINENYTSKTAHEALVQRVKILEEEIIKL